MYLQPSSRLVNPLPPFLDTYSLSMLSLGCKALCFIINFLVFWTICLYLSLVNFKNDPKYLTRTAQVFFLLMKFLLQSFILRSFLVHLRHSFLIFSFILAYLMVSVFSISKYLEFSFSPSILNLPYLFFFLFSHYQHSTFFYTKFHSYILAVYYHYHYYYRPPDLLHFKSQDIGRTNDFAWCRVISKDWGKSFTDPFLFLWGEGSWKVFNLT